MEGRGVQLATSPGYYRSLPALFTGCSKPPAASLRHTQSGADDEMHLPRPSGRRSPAGSLSRRISSCDRSVRSCDRSSVGSACLHHLPGGKSQRRSQKLPGYEGGREGVGESPASEKVSACDERTSAGYGCKEAMGGLVPTADLRLAQKRVS